MKTLLLVTALTLLICNAPAQTADRGMINDISSLKRSNAGLKSRLNEQKLLLLKQARKTDSLASALKSAKSEIKKNAEDQNLLAQSVSQLQTQIETHPSSSGRGKYYAFIVVIGFLIIAILFRSYVSRQVLSVKDVIRENDINFDNKLARINGHVAAEIVGVKALFERYAIEVKQANTRHNAENKENINRLFTEANNIIETHIASLKGAINEQLIQVSNEFNTKITELKTGATQPLNQSNL